MTLEFVPGNRRGGRTTASKAKTPVGARAADAMLAHVVNQPAGDGSLPKHNGGHDGHGQSERAAHAADASQDADADTAERRAAG